MIVFFLAAMESLAAENRHRVLPLSNEPSIAGPSGQAYVPEEPMFNGTPILFESQSPAPAVEDFFPMNQQGLLVEGSYATLEHMWQSSVKSTKDAATQKFGEFIGQSVDISCDKGHTHFREFYTADEIESVGRLAFMRDRRPRLQIVRKRYAKKDKILPKWVHPAQIEDCVMKAAAEFEEESPLFEVNRVCGHLYDRNGKVSHYKVGYSGYGHEEDEYVEVSVFKKFAPDLVQKEEAKDEFTDVDDDDEDYLPLV